MISTERSNSVNVTAAALAQLKRRQQDYADGYRRFWRGEPMSYCANAAERAGFCAAADEDALEQRIARDEYTFIRETMMGY